MQDQCSWTRKFTITCMMIIYIYIVVETYRNVHFIFCEHRSRVKEDVHRV